MTILAALPGVTASYAIPVRQASALPAASFGFHLAMDTLAVRLVVPLTGPTGDLHPQVIRPAPPVPEQRPSRRYAPCLAHQTKKPRPVTRSGFYFRSLAVTYSRTAKHRTTIGAERFHFRVRNGIGWFPLAIAARQTGRHECVHTPAVLFGKSFQARVAARSPAIGLQTAWVLYGQASRAISTG